MDIDLVTLTIIGGGLVIVGVVCLVLAVVCLVLVDQPTSRNSHRSSGESVPETKVSGTTTDGETDGN
jgi:hypothetical protein